METIDANTMKALRDGLRGLGEIPAALDLLDYLDNCDSCRGVWRFLGACYLTHRGFLQSPGTAETARKRMAELRQVAEAVKRCGVANPERVSFDRLDRFGEEA